MIRRRTNWLLVAIGLMIVVAGAVYLARDAIFGPDTYSSGGVP